MSKLKIIDDRVIGSLKCIRISTCRISALLVQARVNPIALARFVNDYCSKTRHSLRVDGHRQAMRVCVWTPTISSVENKGNNKYL